MTVDDYLFAVLHLLQVPETGRSYARTAAQSHTLGSPTLHNDFSHASWLQIQHPNSKSLPHFRVQSILTRSRNLNNWSR
jgi:hypothetical protein